MAGNAHKRERKVHTGGPKTSAGKQASRCNSLKHGFTIAKLLPEVLNKHRVGEYRCKFEQQYLPVNPTEQILVTEMARHAAMMELGENAEIAVLRNGARELSTAACQNILHFSARVPSARLDAVLRNTKD